MPLKLLLTLALSLATGFSSIAQETKKPKKKKKVRPFSWVSPATEFQAKKLPKTVKHATFKSPSMKVDVGYYIYLPPGYDKPENKEKRYPVVYYLHGGRPGGEYKSISISTYVDKAVEAGDIRPVIYVWPNGGPMSWYNYPQKELAFGEDVFVKELVPHIDKTYRTIAKRDGRGLQGFSQGGRGTTRIMFKYPELWGSTAPGGSGYEPEKRIQENDGAESEKVVFSKGYNAWDLAKVYAETKQKEHPLKPLIWVGTKGFNFEYNLKYMKYLEGLGIPYEKLIVPEATHSAKMIYDKMGLQLLKFHDKNLHR